MKDKSFKQPDGDWREFHTVQVLDALKRSSGLSKENTYAKHSSFKLRIVFSFEAEMRALLQLGTHDTASMWLYTEKILKIKEID